MDIKAALLNVILIFTSFMMYYPFFRVYDRQLLEEEQGDLAAESA